jgi:hypothetical protein
VNPEHHPRIFMLQQMAVRHIGKLLRRLVVELHQHLTDSTFNPHRIFPARAMRLWRFTVL